MKKLVLTLLIFTAANAIFSQTNYHQAIGIKFPWGFSITYKKFFTETNNLEAQFISWDKGMRLAALYEFNFYTFQNMNGLAWFVGPGAHIGFWNDDDSIKTHTNKADFGIDGIIGLDYKLKDLPINVSVDWHPSITLVGTPAFKPVSGGIGVRYTF